MSFWKGETLSQELPRLIDPYLEKQIDCAAYTLRIGAEVYVSPTSSADAFATTRRQLDEKESFVIPPGQFAFLLTEERVKVPATAVGFISMKARIKFRGLVNVSGFHVDPGYDGHLIFSVFNAGPSAVHLARGDDCFLIWYASLDSPTTKVRTAPPLAGITSELINPIAGEITSLASLSERVGKVEREHQVLRWMGATLLTLAVAIFIRGCSMPSAQTKTSQRGERREVTARAVIGQPARSSSSSRRASDASWNSQNHQNSGKTGGAPASATSAIQVVVISSEIMQVDCDG